MEMLPGNHEEELPLIYFVNIHCSLSMVGSDVSVLSGQERLLGLKTGENIPGAVVHPILFTSFPLSVFFILPIFGSDCFVRPLRVIRAFTAYSNLRY